MTECPSMRCPTCRGKGEVRISEPCYRTYRFLLGLGEAGALTVREIHEARDKVVDNHLTIPAVHHRLGVLKRAGLVEKCGVCRYRAVPPIEND